MDTRQSELADIQSRDPNTWVEFKLGYLKDKCEEYIWEESSMWMEDPMSREPVLHMSISDFQRFVAEMLEDVVYQNIIDSL